MVYERGTILEGRGGDIKLQNKKHFVENKHRG
jgi:hypothetical protein